MTVAELRQALSDYAPGAKVYSCWGPVTEVCTYENEEEYRVVLRVEIETFRGDLLPG